jgi:hypothetical protein
MQGAVRLDPLTGLVAQWTGPGNVIWEVNSAAAGKYKVALCYAAETGGFKFEIRSTQDKTGGEGRKTQGFFGHHPDDIFNIDKVPRDDPPARLYFLNYERISLQGTLWLPAGRSQVSIHLIEAQSSHVMDLRSLELSPVEAEKRIAGEEERARKHRASTDWFVRAGYGVMFHWTDMTQPRHAPAKAYAEAVRDFNVVAFADMVKDTGAGYVVFTLDHAHPTCPAPIASWEEFHPGWTTRRDLIGDMADALNKRGIRLLLFITPHILAGLKTVGTTQVFQQRMRLEEFVDIQYTVLSEIGARYGKKLAGYFLCCWNEMIEAYPDIPFEKLFEACKAGNTDRIVTFSFWIFPVCTPWQEFWDGEVENPQVPATSRYLEESVGRGLQFQSLLMLDAPWGHFTPNTEMAPPRFSAEELISYVKRCIEKQGVVTINVGIFQDGTIGVASRRMLGQLRRAIRGT